MLHGFDFFGLPAKIIPNRIKIQLLSVKSSFFVKNDEKCMIISSGIRANLNFQKNNGFFLSLLRTGSTSNP
ncbi:MAG: hypothetical protein ACOZCO_14985 [Bacteroidota bacterium]